MECRAGKASQTSSLRWDSGPVLTTDIHRRETLRFVTHLTLNFFSSRVSERRNQTWRTLSPSSSTSLQIPARTQQAPPYIAQLHLNEGGWRCWRPPQPFHENKQSRPAFCPGSHLRCWSCCRRPGAPRQTSRAASARPATQADTPPVELPSVAFWDNSRMERNRPAPTSWSQRLYTLRVCSLTALTTGRCLNCSARKGFTAEFKQWSLPAAVYAIVISNMQPKAHVGSCRDPL